MKKILSLSLITLCFTSCYNASSAMMGATESNLKNHLELTTKCPKDKIIVKDKQKAGGMFTYVVDVCGEEKMYQQFGGTVTELKRD